MNVWQRIRRGSPVTVGLIIINVLVFLWMLFEFGIQGISLASPFSVQSLDQSGALSGTAVQAGEWWRLITPMFIHVTFEHIALNMITLYFLGRYVEMTFGHWRTLVIYLVSGFTGNVWSMFFHPEGLSAGASTAIFGLFGAFIALDVIEQNNPAIHAIARQFSILVVVNLVFDIFAVGIDIWGHIGGLIGGIAVAFLLSVPKRYNNPAVSRWLRLVGLIGVVVANFGLIRLF
ncbi:rhomboid family intramembrane serine protease [Furfurilactobacillus rossiae]|uniref:rhomboid family intramembrane serine protease n=1 Tax=Furfurilactobacillus rossiae TaxID=231049 RepID=UPI001F184C3A|nr:rhomboid family intramembrane serine protease [Furfurilactobacillus rossiae]MCF6164900.1 rhomboid family intramembrane serine protease [Furfurilactobacillus rossiae]